MTVLFRNDKILFLDHSDFVKQLYRRVSVGEEHHTFELNRKLFSIRHISKSGNRKRSYDSECLTKETMKVREMYEHFLTEVTKELNEILQSYSIAETTSVRDLAKNLFETTIFDHGGINGGNNSDTPIKCQIKGERFLIPNKARFFCGCVKEKCKKLEGQQFDIVVADPPWWNKYIRRLSSANEKLSYSMMYNEDIASIPINNLLGPNSIIAVWCTNAPSNVAAVKNIIFPKWGVTYVTTWYWLKVSVDLKPLCPFGSGLKKQPYERIMFGKVGEAEVPEDMLVMSIPSALHSHKPPLLDILKPLSKTENPQTLELFARYLLPHTTSIGYEPLKWQHISLYENIAEVSKDTIEINNR